MLPRDRAESLDLFRLDLFHIKHGLLFLQQDIDLLLALHVDIAELGILLLSLEQLVIDLFDLVVVLGDQGYNLILVFVLSFLSPLDAALLGLS